MTTLLLYGLIVAAVLAFIGLYFGIGWACELLRDRYQARRKHVLRIVPADTRVFDRAKPPSGDKAQREAAYDELRALPEPGKDYISDRNVVLPRTPPAAERVTPLRVWEPSRQLTEAELDEWKERWRAAQGGPVRVLADPPVVTERTPDVDADVEEWQHILAPAERVATPADVADVLPEWIIEALNGHDSTTASVDSIVARVVTS